jgi:pyruvate/2-oxoglutarate dehydrogenase complex dihydrolipoamide acyltransferase (E2) component
MPVEIVIPEIAPSPSASIKVKQWLKQPGDPIRKGEVIAILEISKTDVELEAENDGSLTRIAIPEGKSGKMGDVIGYIE